MKHMPKLFFALVFLTMLVTVGLSVQAQSETEPETPGESAYVSPLDLAREAGLGADVEQQQTIDDISVTVDYVYADAHSVSIFVVIESSDDGSLNVSDPWDGKLIDQNGRTLSGYNGGLVPKDRTQLNRIAAVDAEFYFMPFGSEPEFDSPDDEIELTFTLSATTDPVRRTDLSSANNGSKYDFQFDFRVPFYHAVEKQVDQTQTAAGKTIRLKSVSVTPISAKIELCNAFPTDRVWAIRDAVLEVDAQRMTPHWLHLMPYIDRDCLTTPLSVYSGLDPQQLEFQIGALGEYVVQDQAIDWSKLRTELRTQGVEVEVNSDGTLSQITAANPADETIYIDVLNDLGYGERIEGPWTFEVEF
jgi:hypothetical protein